MRSSKYPVIPDWELPIPQLITTPVSRPDTTRKLPSQSSRSACTSTTLVNSDIKAFDVEADMAFALVSSDPNARPKNFRNLFEECIFVFTAMMAVASTTFLQGAIVINTGTIGQDLNMTAAQVSWIAAAIGLASGSFMLFCSKTADLFGRKIQLLIGLLLLSLFSFLTAFAPDPVSMNVLCGLLGLGTAIIAPPAMGTLFATYPAGTRRNRVTGAMGAANPLGFIFGSMSSGLATKYASWRQSFLVVAVFFFVMAVMAVWTMPAKPRSGSSSQLIKEFDYLGTVLAIAGMAFVGAALTEAPRAGWHSSKVLVMLFVGAGALSSFALWEQHAPCPLLPAHIFGNPTFTLTIICTGLGYMSFITNQFWISLYMQEIQGLEPLTIAIRLLPQAILGTVWSYLGEELISFISGRLIMAAGGLGYVGGAILILLITPETSYWALLFPALCVTVIGADFQFIVSNLYVSSHLAPSQSSLGAGILQTVLRLSISLGLAITSAIHGALDQTPFGQAHPTYAYSRVFLCTIIFASLSLVMIPFLRIGRQGTPADDGGEEGFELPSSLGRCQSQGSLWSSVSSHHFGGRWGEGPGVHSGDGWGSGTAGWMWADADRYERCLKCGDERSIVVAGVPHHHQAGNGPRHFTPDVSCSGENTGHTSPTRNTSVQLQPENDAEQAQG
ncbi:hypothetical protein B2J93_2329 [Marssonina coronariae]|uniref:Major facilitator superfamily (MFS) profile domain-containing protein n=1 Tax=Diplocarpon coronariae TaxID=2795749 RepID=A0A218Z107_9HELO|nr:hypothetical protein B2J93_2329 [Marssonina coronariae]